MPQPLPVDVVTSTWDYIVGGVSIVSGLATAGALLIAALAYRRQVDDNRRSQAAKVDFTTQPAPEGRVLLQIVNNGDNTVHKLGVSVEHMTDPLMKYGFRSEFIGAHGHVDILMHDEEELVELQKEMRFIDASGHEWLRENDGGLLLVRKHRAIARLLKFVKLKLG